MRAGGDRLSHQVFFIKRGEHDDSALGDAGKDRLGRSDAIHTGHSDIQDGYVSAVAQRCGYGF